MLRCLLSSSSPLSLSCECYSVKVKNVYQKSNNINASPNPRDNDCEHSVWCPDVCVSARLCVRCAYACMVVVAVNIIQNFQYWGDDNRHLYVTMYSSVDAALRLWAECQMRAAADHIDAISWQLRWLDFGNRRCNDSAAIDFSLWKIIIEIDKIRRTRLLASTALDSNMNELNSISRPELVHYHVVWNRNKCRYNSFWQLSPMNTFLFLFYFWPNKTPKFPISIESIDSNMYCAYRDCPNVALPFSKISFFTL